jgi:hypothetical protein
MNSLMMAIQTIALLCGPQNQTGQYSSTVKEDSRKCQIQLLRCVQTKVQGQTSLKDYEQPLAQCLQEVK